MLSTLNPALLVKLVSLNIILLNRWESFVSSLNNPFVESFKLISEIDKALLRIKDETYGYCLDTAEPIGLKRLMARPVAKYTIAAQEKHEKDEKVHADD